MIDSYDASTKLKRWFFIIQMFTKHMFDLCRWEYTHFILEITITLIGY